MLTFPRARRSGTARRPAQTAGLLLLQPRRRHGDLLVSLGIAALLHEEPYGAAVRAAERRGRQGTRQRRPGKRRPGNAARAVIEERLEARRREALGYMNRRLWEE